MQEQYSMFRNIEKSFRRQLSAEAPIVVRFDGKNITKNHKKYHLMDVDGFTRTIFDAAVTLAKDTESLIYAALDEVSIVFLHPLELFGRTQDRDLLYSAIMILQDFLQLTAKKYPEVKFNVSVFNIPNNAGLKYIAYRKHFAFSTAVTYYAKEYLHRSEYVGKNESEILETLKRCGYDITSKNIKLFLNGMESSTHTNVHVPVIDTEVIF